VTSGRVVRAWRLVRRAGALVALLCALAALAGCPYAGRYLIIDRPLQKSDALVVLSGAQVDRWLESVDLYREGYAAQILLSPGYEDPLGDQLRAQGIRFPRLIDVQRNAMLQLGIPPAAIEIMPRGYDNTADEAAGVRTIAQTNGWRRVIVVTSKYHTRRTLFAFERELRGTGIDVQVRGSRHDRVTPDGWWKNRSDLRWVVSELQKLAAYRLGLGK
jgi:uncharacterized SAM-binding protein YcdF (DUF218 family)